ncbi:MAG TPA: hypothetical protein VGE40_05995 [Bacilli bacterium]
MILYQLAKWMEEREHLTRTINESDGDISFLLDKRQQVENRMITEANRFLEQDGYLR